MRGRAGRHAAVDQLHAPDESDVTGKVDGAAARSVGEGMPKAGRQVLAVAELEHHVGDLQAALGHHQRDARGASLILSDVNELALPSKKCPPSTCTVGVTAHSTGMNVSPPRNPKLT